MRVITAVQLKRMSFSDGRVELSEGKLIRKPFFGFRDGCVCTNLLGMLLEHADRHELGAVVGSRAGFRLSRLTVRTPSVAFISRARLEKVECPKGFFPGAPDLAVEVFSPSDRKGELSKKVQQYFAAGTRLVWAVFPTSQQVYVYHGPKQITVLDADDVLKGERVLPGFSLRVSEIFA